MKRLVTKFIAILKSPTPFYRFFQAINKSPLKYITKFFAILFSFRIFITRKKLIEQIRLDSAEKKILSNLRQYGYCDITGFMDANLLNSLETHARDKIERLEQIKATEVTKTKDFWVRLSDEDLRNNTLTSENPMVRIAIEENLLRVIASYFEHPAFLNSVLLTMSIYTGEELKGSQFWHLDPDDTKMLKFFVYLTEVNDNDDGPFTFVNRESAAKVSNDFFMRHLPDSEIKKFINESEILRMIKPKLSCFLVDTGACYHMGSRLAPGHSRLLFTASFSALPSNYPNGGKETVAIGKTTKLTPLQLAALRISIEP